LAYSIFLEVPSLYPGAFFLFFRCRLYSPTPGASLNL